MTLASDPALAYFMIAALWLIPMGGVAFAGSPRAVLALSALILLFLLFRIVVASGPFASAAVPGILVLALLHVLGTVGMYILAVFVRRRLNAPPGRRD